MKKCVQCILYCCMLCYGVSGFSTKFIEASPGQTIVLKYRLNATNADWFGPSSGASYDNKDIGSDIALDRNGENKTWNTIQYTDDVMIRNSLPHKNRLHIVGNNIKGEFFLEIRNVSVDDTGLYRCNIYTLMTNISRVTRLFIVNLKYVPDLLITFKPRMPIVEGSSLSLCCLSKNILPKETVEWLNKTRGLQERQNRGKTCLGFELINRNDSGTYSCKAEHERKIITKNVTLRVLYPPIVEVRNHTFNQNDTNRKILCFPDGDPQNYTYSKWEHRSFFNEHIRYFNAETRHLVLRIQDKQHRYKDSGIYICSVSNGVPDKNGIYVQNGSSNVFSKGPPVFVKDNTRIQYGEKGKHMDLKVNVYSISNITCQYISTDHVENISLDTNVNRITTTDQLHGKPFKIMAWQVVFRFTTLASEQLKKYTVTVCNENGHSKYAISLQFRVNISLEANTLSVKDVVIIVLLILIAVILVITGTYILFLKRRYKMRFIEIINNRAEEDISADSAHYIDIIEVNNVLTTSQGTENNSQTNEANDTEADNISIAQMSTEQNSSLSNSNSDTTEHLNSEYEHPYTTLVTNNSDEDEHMYNVSKQNSAIENILPSRNAASEPFVEIIEQDLSSDNIRTHFYANEGQGNVKLNDNVKDVIAKDNGSHPSSFLSKKYEPEYINLSLKQ